MDNAVLIVLVGLAVLTLAQGIYVWLYLPRKMEERLGQSLKAFSQAIELRIPSHEGISSRVVVLSRAVGRALKLDRQQLKGLHRAAMLREIGLCAVPYTLMNEIPKTQWNDEDRKVFERYPEVSAAMLEVVPSLHHLAPIVRHHRVPYDGSMGPFAPSREDLPMESRILKVVGDCVWHERYQGGMLALESLRSSAGKEYDPQVVQALMKVLKVRKPSNGVNKLKAKRGVS